MGVAGIRTDCYPLGVAMLKRKALRDPDSVGDSYMRPLRSDLENAQVLLERCIRRHRFAIWPHLWRLIGVSAAHRRISNPYFKLSHARVLSGWVDENRNDTLKPPTSEF